MLVAVINGHYDLARDLLERGADPNVTSDDGAAPLFAVLNIEWSLRTWYPQPAAFRQQETSYLELMQLLLDAGADPNQRTTTHIWYAAYNAGRMGVDFTGATPFWRAAYAADVEAMRLLVEYGADPNMSTLKLPGRNSFAFPGAQAEQEEQLDPSGLPRVPIGGPAVHPLHAASGVGFGTSRVAQQHRSVPDGWLPAVRYLVEELGVDANLRDHDGFNAIHHAAARGDNATILYLVSRGAEVGAISRRGQTHGRPGQQPRAAGPAAPGDGGAAGEARVQEQPPVPLLREQSLMGKTPGLLAAVLLAPLTSAGAAAQDTVWNRYTLEGLDGVYIRAETNQGCEGAGVSAESIRADAEAALTEAEVPLLTEREMLDSPGLPGAARDLRVRRRGGWRGGLLGVHPGAAGDPDDPGHADHPVRGDHLVRDHGGGGRGGHHDGRPGRGPPGQARRVRGGLQGGQRGRRGRQRGVAGPPRRSRHRMSVARQCVIAGRIRCCSAIQLDLSTRWWSVQPLKTEIRSYSGTTWRNCPP